MLKSSWIHTGSFQCKLAKILYKLENYVFNVDKFVQHLNELTLPIKVFSDAHGRLKNYGALG